MMVISAITIIVSVPKIIILGLWGTLGSSGILWDSGGRIGEGFGKVWEGFERVWEGFGKVWEGFGDGLRRLWEGFGRVWPGQPAGRLYKQNAYSRSSASAANSILRELALA